MITTSQEEDDFMAPQTFISGIRNSLEHNCFDYDMGTTASAGENIWYVHLLS
jgi:hypothetical protein